MDEPANPLQSPQPIPFWRCVFILVAIALLLRVWVVARTEVAARDSINFIQYALRFENEPFTKVLREAEQPPGYPLAVLVASWPVRAWRGTTDPAAMALAAQIASLVFGALLVVPMALLGRELAGPRIGLIAAGAFQCLPSWVRLTSDGLSEAMFLFCSATALWLAVRAISDRRSLTMFACGLATGCAYFTRPEGAEIVIATSLILGVAAWIGITAWKSSALQLASLLAGFAVFLGPFYATTGRLSNKPTARFLLGEEVAKKAYFSSASSGALPMAVWWNAKLDQSSNKWAFAVKALVSELVQSSRYLGLVLTTIGLIIWRTRVRQSMAGWLLFVLCVMHAAILIKMTSSVGYLSERHTALLVLAAAFPAALAVEALACRIQSRTISANAVAIACVVIGLLSACPTLARGLHANRAGHRAAGEWLAQHAPASAGICDPFCWAHYYAGRVFHDESAREPIENFIILENNDNQHSRLPMMPDAKAKAKVGQLVYSWPENVPADKVQVNVYRWLRPQTPATTPNASRSSPQAPIGG